MDEYMDRLINWKEKRAQRKEDNTIDILIKLLLVVYRYL
jgi:hypothetical protein